MKKPVMLILCVLFMVCTPVFAYHVGGRVLDENGNSVSGATVTINCYPSSGGSFNDTDDSNAAGLYYGGWTGDCVDETIVVKAVKGTKSGTVSWDAEKNLETQNITISQPPWATAELHCEPDPVPLSEAEPVKVSSVKFYLQLAAVDPVYVNGGTVTMYYDSEKMNCMAVESNEPFDYSFSADFSTPGVIHVSAYAAPGLFVEIYNGEAPESFFDITFALTDFDNPGTVSSVTLESSEITTDAGIVSAFPSQTKNIIEGESTSEPYLRVADQGEWEEALQEEYVRPMETEEWQHYMTQWYMYTEEGEPYPDVNFMPAEPPTGGLYVYEGDEADPCTPSDAGLVMAWGDSDGNSTSAWMWDYKKDPDLSNCTINLVVTAPQWGMGVNGQVNQVSFGLQNPPNIGGPIRAWYWNCGAAGSGAPITWGVPTRLTIDTSKTGVAAATPTASAYMNNPGFSLKSVQWLLLDENGTWVGGPNPVPAFGQFSFLWNYWHWIMISPNTTLSKNYYKKWSQAAVVVDANDPPYILGWDEYSEYYNPPIVADDWNCVDDRPITDLHWWGSFIGWNNSDPPPTLPQAFHIGIWNDVPDPNPADPCTFSHPGTLIWEHTCDNYVMNFAGYDVDPRLYPDGEPDNNEPFEPEEACFQFNQLLSQKDWFYQEPDPCEPNGTIYWLSIAAIWDPCQPEPWYDWGWKTRPHKFNDDAVIIQNITGAVTWPPAVGSMWGSGVPIQHPPYPDEDSISFDMAFELTTNEPSPNDEPASPDLNYDGIVNLKDVAILANKWLDTVQY